MRYTIIAGLFLGYALTAQAAPAPTVLPPKAVGLADAVPDAHGVKRMAVLRGLDKLTGRAIDVNAPVGVPVRFGTLTLTVRYCYTVPPEEPPETTAFLQIDENIQGQPPKRMFSSWMFASTPALNALEHPTYDVWVITCKTEEPLPAAAPPPLPPGIPAPPASPAARPAPATAPTAAAPARPKP